MTVATTNGMPARMGRWLAVMLVALAACGGDDGGGSGPSTEGSFSMAVSPKTFSVARGQPYSVNINFTRSNFTGPIQLGATGVPAGINAEFIPKSLGGGEVVSVLILTPSATMAPGTYPLTITATASSASSQASSLSVTVTQ